MDQVIEKLEAQLDVMKRLPSHREVALAMTKLQESIMWLKAAKEATK
jgi:hypothetical protein